MARKRRRYYNPLAPMSLQMMNSLLNRTVASQILPGQQEIASQRRAAIAQAEQDQQRSRDSAAGLAELMKTIAPQIQGDYRAASGAQAAFAKGLGTLQNQIQQTDAQKAGDFLSRVVGAGSDQIAQVQGQGRGVGDTSYALGGQIPADMLNTQGAAFTAGARQLPAYALSAGQREVDAIRQARDKKQTELDQALQDLMAKVPGLRAQDYKELIGIELQKEAARTQQSYLGVSQDRLNLDATVAANKITNDSATNKRDQILAARKARTSGFADARTKTYDGASRIVEGGKPVPNPKYGIGPGQSIDVPKTITKRPTYQQAYTTLYNQYGQPLLSLAPKGQKGWWKRQIDAMITKAIQTAELAAGVKLVRAPNKKARPVWKNRGD